jgi:hypothetical protein
VSDQYAGANAWRPPAGKSCLHLGNRLGELRPDVVAETPVALPWAFTIAVPSEMV